MSKKIAVLSLVSAALFVTDGMGQGVEGDFRPRLKASQKLLESPSAVWWARPLDDAWSKYDFIRLDGHSAKKLIDSFKTAAIEEKACNWNLLALEYPDADKRGQGVLVFDGGEDKRVAFWFKSTFVNRKAMGFADIGKFDPKSGLLEFDSVGVMIGVVLSVDFRNILQLSKDLQQKERADASMTSSQTNTPQPASGKPSPSGKGELPNNSRSAPCQPQEGPPSANPRSAPK
jgi:hypothetical protein